MGSEPDHVFLLDNGSLAPAAVRSLRSLARSVGERVGRSVEPVSVLHADRVPANELDGRAAEVVDAAVRTRAAQGARSFALVPLFFGPSRALTDYIPHCATQWRADFPGLEVKVAPTLHSAGDDHLARMLADLVRAELANEPATRVAVVDHGSPVRAVTAVRDDVAAQLSGLLHGQVSEVAPCSMERRAGVAYAFNEPSLERLLTAPGWRESRVIVAQLFLQPGKHAGPDGDIATICERAVAQAPHLRVRRTALLGEHPELPALLAKRTRELLR